MANRNEMIYDIRWANTVDLFPPFNEHVTNAEFIRGCCLITSTLREEGCMTRADLADACHFHERAHGFAYPFAHLREEGIIYIHRYTGEGNRTPKWHLTRRYRNDVQHLAPENFYSPFIRRLLRAALNGQGPAYGVEGLAAVPPTVNRRAGNAAPRIANHAAAIVGGNPPPQAPSVARVGGNLPAPVANNGGGLAGNLPNPVVLGVGANPIPAGPVVDGVGNPVGNPPNPVAAVGVANLVVGGQVGVLAGNLPNPVVLGVGANPIPAGPAVIGAGNLVGNPPNPVAAGGVANLVVGGQVGRGAVPLPGALNGGTTGNPPPPQGGASSINPTAFPASPTVWGRFRNMVSPF
jgi:hypothetical protein